MTVCMRLVYVGSSCIIRAFACSWSTKFATHCGTFGGDGSSKKIHYYTVATDRWKQDTMLPNPAANPRVRKALKTLAKLMGRARLHVPKMLKAEYVCSVQQQVAQLCK